MLIYSQDFWYIGKKTEFSNTVCSKVLFYCYYCNLDGGVLSEQYAFEVPWPRRNSSQLFDFLLSTCCDTCSQKQNLSYGSFTTAMSLLSSLGKNSLFKTYTWQGSFGKHLQTKKKGECCNINSRLAFWEELLDSGFS